MYILFKKQLHLVYIYGGEILHFLPTTVHVSKYLFFGFIHAVFFLFLFISIPKVGWNAKNRKKKQRENKSKNQILSNKIRGKGAFKNDVTQRGRSLCDISK